MFRRTRIAPWQVPPSNGGQRYPELRVKLPTLTDQHVADRGRIHRFHEMHVEARFTRATAIDVLPPAGERDQHRAARPQLSARMRRATSQPSSWACPTSSTTISGLLLPRERQRFFAVGSAMHLVAFEPQHQRETLERILIVVGDEDIASNLRRRFTSLLGLRCVSRRGIHRTAAAEAVNSLPLVETRR